MFGGREKRQWIELTFDYCTALLTKITDKNQPRITNNAIESMTAKLEFITEI